MSQISFSDAEYAGKRKKTRRKVFLEEMNGWCRGRRCSVRSRRTTRSPAEDAGRTRWNRCARSVWKPICMAIERLSAAVPSVI